MAVCISTAASIAASQSVKVAMISSPMVLTTDAAVLLGRAAHDLDADRDLVARRDVAEDLEQPRAADDVGEKNREFLVLAHVRVRTRRGLHNSDYRRETGGAPKPPGCDARRLIRREAAHGPELRSRLPETLLRHVVARSRGRRVLYADAAARARVAGASPALCARSPACIAWSGA